MLVLKHAKAKRASYYYFFNMSTDLSAVVAEKR